MGICILVVETKIATIKMPQSGGAEKTWFWRLRDCGHGIQQIFLLLKPVSLACR